MTFREIIAARETKGETVLYSSFLDVENKAKNGWMAAMRPVGGSLNSVPHIERVELLVDKMVPDNVKQSFSSAEVYILLCAIVLHDIGKTHVVDRDSRPWKTMAGKLVGHSDYHGYNGCKIISNNWMHLGVFDDIIAKNISLLVCSHCWQKPMAGKSVTFEKMQSISDDFHPVNKWTSKYDDNAPPDMRCTLDCQLSSSYTAKHGMVHLPWLGALLRIGDEFENHSHRMVPEYLLNNETGIIPPVHLSVGVSDQNTDATVSEWRRKIYGVRFDHFGKCIVLITGFSFTDYTNYLANTEESLLKKAIRKAVNMSDLLRHWTKCLNELGIYFEEVFIELTDPFPFLFLGKGKSTSQYYRINDYLIHEPGLIKSTLEDVSDCAMRLCKGVPGKIHRPFSWKTLCAASGIADENIVKKSMLRLQAFSSLVNKLDPDTNYGQSDFARIQELSSYEIIITQNGWVLRKREQYSDPQNNPLPSYDDDITPPESQNGKYISTGLDELDYLLSPEKGDKLQKRGFYIPANDGRDSVPIVVIEGGSGGGKTTLLAQIASNLAFGADTDGKFFCLFYSLEQEPERIIQGIKGFDYFDVGGKQRGNSGGIDIQQRFVNLEKVGWVNWRNSEAGVVVFPTLTPTWDMETQHHHFDNFNRRFEDLKNSVQWALNPSVRGKKQLICFIDSLNAFSSYPLNREQVSRLFSFFRRHKILLIASLERQGHWGHDSEITHYNISRYLADVEIALDNETQANYYRQTIEIKKTRFNRRVLGKHQIKIKSPNKSRTGHYDPRVGVVIFPSIHAILSRTRSSLQTKRNAIKARQPLVFIEPRGEYSQGKGTNYFVAGSIKLDIYRQSSKANQGSFDDNSCFLVSGPHGCHKFAIGLNLLLNHKPYKKLSGIKEDNFIKLRNAGKFSEVPDCNARIEPKKLIISFAEENAIKLEAVPLLNELASWSDSLKLIIDQVENTSVLSEALYGKVQQNKNTTGQGLKIYYPIISVITIAMGQILPEEFMYYITRYLRENPSIDAVMVHNTAHVRNRFPALSSEPLFMPSLADILKANGCYSVFIDISKNNDPDKHSLALMAAADYRILVKQKNDLNKTINMITHNLPLNKYDMEGYNVSVNNTDTPVRLCFDRLLCRGSAAPEA